MKKKNITKKVIDLKLVLGFLLLCFTALGQPEKTVWNGKEYFIYPGFGWIRYPRSVFWKYVTSYEKPLFDAGGTRILKVQEQPIPRLQYPDDPAGLRSDLDTSFMRRVLLIDPAFLYDYSHTYENIDYLPTYNTQGLPDGDYIEYFEGVPWIDGKMMRVRQKIVSAIFHVENGLMNGPAQWFTHEGKKLYEGTFLNGMREGEWTYRDISITRMREREKEKTDAEGFLKAQVFDTTVTIVNYHLDVKHGPYVESFKGQPVIIGQYDNGRETGHWEYRRFVYLKDESTKYLYDYIKTDKVVKGVSFTYAANPKLVKGHKVIRDRMITEEAFYNDSPYIDVCQEDYFYRGGTFGEMTDLFLYGNFMPDDFEYYNHNANKVDFEDMHIQGEIINKYGYTFLYEGVYESFYTNGQLMMRFEIKDGILQSEDPVYWDNGKVANEVISLGENKGWEVRFYDYNGKLYHKDKYDREGVIIFQPGKY